MRKSMKKAEEVRKAICKMVFEDRTPACKVDQFEREIIAKALDEAYQEGQKDKMYEAIVLADMRVKEGMNEAIERIFDMPNDRIIFPISKEEWLKFKADKIRSLKQRRVKC